MFTVITKENCPYCTQAKAFLERYELEYQEMKIGVDISRDDVINRYFPWKTVPIILYNQSFIGGYTELSEKLSSNPYFGKQLLQEDET